MNRPWLLPLLLIACTTPEVIDTSPPDGAASPPDSTLPDSTPGPTIGTVTVHASSILGHFDVTTWIVVHDHLGEPWSVILPATEETTVQVPAGGAVTLLQRGTSGLRRTTFIGVESGDVLAPRTALSDGDQELVTIQVPRYPGTPGSYVVEFLGDRSADEWDFPCRASSFDPPDHPVSGVRALTLRVSARCLEPGPQLVVIKSYDDAHVLRGSMHAVGEMPTTLDLTDHAWSPPAEAHVHMTGWTTLRPEEVCVREWLREAGNSLRRSAAPTCTQVQSNHTGVIDATFRVPAGLPVVWDTTVKARAQGGTSLSVVEEVRRAATPGGTFDLSWALGPTPSVDVDPGSRPIVHIGAQMDHVGAVTTIVDNAVSGSRWEIVHPRTSSFQVPRLPAAFAGYELGATRSATARFYLPGAFPTYASFRNLVLTRGTQTPMVQRTITSD